MMLTRSGNVRKRRGVPQTTRREELPLEEPERSPPQGVEDSKEARRRFLSTIQEHSSLDYPALGGGAIRHG